MELNVAGQPARKTAADGLIRAVKRADAVLARCGGEEETYLEGATAYTHATRPAAAAVNLALDLRVPPGAAAEQVVAKLTAHFDSAAVPCHSMDASDTVWPAALAAAVEQRGYRPVQRQVLELRQARIPHANDAVQIISARALPAECATLHRRRAADNGADEDSAEQIADACLDQLDDPRLDVLLARVNRKPAGLAGVLTLGNIGVVVDVFATGNDDGVLNTLAARLLDHCQRSQFEQVIVCLLERDARLAFFESLGFEPVAQFTRFVRGPQAVQ